MGEMFVNTGYFDVRKPGPRIKQWKNRITSYAGGRKWYKQVTLNNGAQLPYPEHRGHYIYYAKGGKWLLYGSKPLYRIVTESVIPPCDGWESVTKLMRGRVDNMILIDRRKNKWAKNPGASPWISYGLAHNKEPISMSDSDSEMKKIRNQLNSKYKKKQEGHYDFADMS